MSSFISTQKAILVPLQNTEIKTGKYLTMIKKKTVKSPLLFS